MRAYELMIGDWVSVLARFLEISTKGAATSSSYNLCRKNCRVDGINGYLIAIDKICLNAIVYDPIPLTAEILEKNGFEFKNISTIAKSSTRLLDNATSIHFQFHTEHGSQCFCNIKHSGAGSYEITKLFAYVHELQHALRLCGLNELADNFKV